MKKSKKKRRNAISKNNCLKTIQFISIMLNIIKTLFDLFK
jgi:hypothetical protein